MKTAYYLDADGNHVAVTTETPKGPLKGFVFIGKRIVGDNAPTEEAFGIDQVAKFKKVEIADVPARCLVAFGYHTVKAAHGPQPWDGYDEPPAPVVEAHVEAHEPTTDEGVKCRAVQYGPAPVSCLPFALGLVLFVASLALFVWMKNSP